MAFEFNRNIRDASLTVSKAFPAAAANNNSGTIDLGAAPSLLTENIEIEIAVPDLANNSDATKTILITLQDSADDSTYADVSPLHQLKVVGVTTTGSVAVKKRIKLPPGVRRYIQFNQLVASGGGDNTASSATYSVLA